MISTAFAGAVEAGLVALLATDDDPVPVAEAVALPADVADEVVPPPALLVGGVELEPPLPLELHAANAAPAAARDPTWKKRRRVRLDVLGDSSGLVM